MTRTHTLYPELAGLPFADLREKFSGPPVDGAEYAVAFYDEVAVLMREVGGSEAVKYLLRLVDTVDSVRLGSVFLGLTWPPPVQTPRVRELLIGHLDDPNPYIVMRAVRSLTDLRDGAAWARILQLQQHEDPLVRGAVLEYLAKLDERKGVAAAVRALEDAAPGVREAAIDVLDELHAVEAAPLLRPFLDDADPSVRQAAEWALNHFSS